MAELRRDPATRRHEDADLVAGLRALGMAGHRHIETGGTLARIEECARAVGAG
ncbi:hypothetical protein ACH4YO_28510 [Streptomyces noursei]|uniref:hypothetical protein n=1 Tax=Streptomyces noursei TaxID=1971 RepID=UPI0033CBC09E